MTAIFPMRDVNFPDSNRRHAFIFARNDLKFEQELVRILVNRMFEFAIVGSSKFEKIG